MTPDKINDELDLLYRAVANPAYLEALLTLIRQKTHSTSGTLQIDDYHTMEVIDGYFQGFSADALVPYKAYYSKINVLTAAAADDPGLFSKIFISDQLISLKAFKASEFYNDWIRPEVGTDYSIWLSLNDRREKIIKLTLQRQAGALSYSQDNTWQYLAALRPHLKTAIKAIQAVREDNRPIQELRYLNKPAVLLNTAMKCREHNQQFQQMMDRYNWLTLGAGDILRLPASLQTDVRSALQANTRLHLTGQINRELYYRDTHQDFIITLTPFRQDKPSILHPDETESLTLMTISEYRRQLHLPLLRKIFGLTEVEAITVAMLFHGKSLQQIHIETGRSMHTLRSLLKVVFHKCGVNRQAELIARVAASLAFR